MSMAYQVKIPLINPNEPEALLASVRVKEGQRVQEGDVLCVLETTKSTFEVTAPASGFIINLKNNIGKMIPAGEILCYIASSPSWKSASQPMESGERGTGKVPSGLRITQPALTLANRNRLDLALLPIGPLVTEDTVLSLIKKSQPSVSTGKLQSIEIKENSLIIYGGGGHGKSLVDLIRSAGSYHISGLVDDGLETGRDILGVPVLGNGDLLQTLFDQGIRLAVNAVGGIGNITIRKIIFDRLRSVGFDFPNMTHPTAVVEPNAELSPGVQVFPLAYVGSDVRVGFGSIINTSAVVSHECIIGDYVNISPGALLAGAVSVGSGSLIGMGATINLGVNIGNDCRIGNSATVKTDLASNTIIRAGSSSPD